MTDLRPLAHCLMLEYLNLTDCFELSDVSPLAKLPRLRKLILANTNVTNLESLSAIPNLEISFDEDDAD